MRYFGCNGYLVVAESFKMAIGEYRRVFGEDPEEMTEKAGFGHDRYLSEGQAETLADNLHDLVDNTEDTKVGDILRRLRAITAFVESSLADDPVTPGVYDICAGKWQPVAKTVEKATAPSVDPDGWIEWTGGECPVDGHAVVHVKYRDGAISTSIAACFDWQRRCDDRWYIVAYRVVS